MALRLRYVLVIVAVIVAAYIAMVRHRPLWPALADVPVLAQGTFQRDGGQAREPPTFGASLHRWGVSAEGNEHTGSLRLGPFPASHRLRLAIIGFPAAAGNEIYLERTDTHERQPIVLRDAGSNWVIVDVNVPEAWKGHPITLNAIHHSATRSGWFGVTEPLRGGPGEGNGAFYQTLTCWLLNGLLLGVVWLAAVRLVMARRWTTAAWAPLLAAGFVATAAYALFWLYFASPVVGRIASAGLIVAGAVVALRPRENGGPTKRSDGCDVAMTTLLMLTIGFFYLTVLHLFPSSRGFYDLAANRLREELPADNSLPRDLTLGLDAGSNLRPVGAEWQTSDRPPLQAGWQLITLPFSKALGLDPDTATGTAALWFQLLWIPAAWGLFHSLRVPRGRAAAWIIVLSLTGYLAQNTIFTWPKLSAAALGCGAFGLWFLAEDGHRRLSHYALGALLAALAWLSHGGIAFSFVALVPWILWRMLRSEARGWLVAAAVFLALALPWFGFQKLYNPPGDRLIKWHLGGQIAPDPRGPLTVIRDAYAKTPRAEIIFNKLSNFRFLVLGEWHLLADFNPANAEVRRNGEFFCTFRAMTWWLFAPVVLGGALLWRRWRRGAAPLNRGPSDTTGSNERGQAAATSDSDRPMNWRPHIALLAWSGATLIVWPLLIFGPYNTSIATGSYATLLTLFIVAAAWLDLAGRQWIFLIAALQIATFTTTWAWSNSHLHGTPAAWPYLVLAAMGMTFLFAVVIREGSANGDSAERGCIDHL